MTHDTAQIVGEFPQQPESRSTICAVTCVVTDKISIYVTLIPNDRFVIKEFRVTWDMPLVSIQPITRHCQDWPPTLLASVFNP